MENLIILIASRCFLGREVRENLSEDVTALINEINVAMGPLTTMFPHLPIPPHRRRDKARKRLDDIFSKVILSRRSSPKSEDDMLQSLVNSKYKDGRATTVTEVTGMLITALYGGQRSSSTTATWVGANLFYHKKFWLHAMEEQIRLMKKYGDAITYDALSEMHVLYRCIKEALRLHPPIPMLLRQSHKDFTVTIRKGDKYDIPKGHIIAVSPILSNRVPHIYKNPDSHDPERFCPGREEDKLAGPFSFISFGGGKHSCLGESFAFLELKTIWSYLIRNFELELISSFPETKCDDIIHSPKGKVMIRYKRRKLVIE
uniref:Cytochrome P450 n=2 Tax=Chenopodium quinoa TaxID=63459 RepID=A0A803MV87_CHEQI